MSGAWVGPPTDLHASDLRSIARSIEPAFPSAAEDLRGIAAALAAALAAQEGEPIGAPCAQCGPGYRIGDDGCRHGAAGPRGAAREGERGGAEVAAAPWDERLYAGFLDMGLDESDADEAVRVVERLWGAAAELENWWRACDEVGVPHNPAALIRHHRIEAQS